MDKHSIETINRLGNQLQTLTGGIDLNWDESAVNSTEDLMALCVHNSQELKRIDELDEERQQRVLNLIPSILAATLQEEAMRQYGNTDCSSIRGVMDAWFNRSEYQGFLGKLRHTTRLTLRNYGLNDEQIDAVEKDILDKLPHAMIDVIQELTIPLTYMPLSEAQSVGAALADMMREVGA